MIEIINKITDQLVRQELLTAYKRKFHEKEPTKQPTKSWFTEPWRYPPSRGCIRTWCTDGRVNLDCFRQLHYELHRAMSPSASWICADFEVVGQIELLAALQPWGDIEPFYNQGPMLRFRGIPIRPHGCYDSSVIDFVRDNHSATPFVIGSIEGLQ